MSEIKVVKLQSIDDEIIARKQADTQTNTVVLEQPMNIVKVPPDSSGRIGIIFVPWFMGANDDVAVTISRDHILAEVDPKDTIEKSYLSKITGLTL